MATLPRDMVRKRPIKISVFDYPEHLNPFREEEEEERRLAQLALEGRTTRCHLLLGSPMSLDSGATSPLSISGVCTPVNGTLRRRMKKRRAPLPPAVPGSAIQVSEVCCTSMPATSPAVESRQQDDAPAEGFEGPTGPAGDLDIQLHSMVTESPLQQDESVNCQQETPLRHSTPPPASISHTDSRPPEHSPSEVAAAAEMNQRLSTDKEHLDSTSEVIAATSAADTQEQITEQSTNTNLTEIHKDIILPDQKNSDEEAIISPNMTEITTDENVKITENITESEDVTVNEEEKITVPENDDLKPMAVPEIAGTEIGADKIEITNEEVTPTIICEEKAKETALPYIDQDSNVPSITVDEDPCKLSNGHCNGNAEKLGTSPVPSPRLRRLDKFTPQVSHVEIRISDIAEV